MTTNNELDEVFADTRASFQQSINLAIEVMRDGSDTSGLLKQILMMSVHECQLLAGIYAELLESRHDRRRQN